MNGRPAPGERWTDEAFDVALARVLRGGVLAAAAVVAAGAALFLWRHGGGRPSYGAFRGERDAWRSVTGVVRDAWSLDGGGLIQLGVLLLIATPIARVVLSVAGFLRQGDRLYAAITAIVLILLVYSLASG